MSLNGSHSLYQPSGVAMPSGRKSQINQQIDDNLKRAFEEVAQEPVPQRFTDLLDRLKKADGPFEPKQDGDAS